MHIYREMLSRNKRCQYSFAAILVILGSSVLARPAYHAVRRTYVSTTSKFTWLNALNAPSQTYSDGKPVAWLQIDNADIDSMVLLGADEHNLSKFPSCHSSYSIPGNGGVSVILGHRDTHFNGLKKVCTGDLLKVQTAIGEWKSYSITECKVVNSSVVSDAIKEKQSSNNIVLLTCYPFNYIGPAPKRYMVWAEPI